MSNLNQIEPLLLYDLYPNPVSRILNIKFESLEAGNYILSIYNILGVEVFNNSYTGGNPVLEDKINVSTFPEGLYIYQLKDDKQHVIATKQFIVNAP